MPLKYTVTIATSVQMHPLETLTVHKQVLRYFTRSTFELQVNVCEMKLDKLGNEAHVDGMTSLYIINQCQQIMTGSWGKCNWYDIFIPQYANQHPNVKFPLTLTKIYSFGMTKFEMLHYFRSPKALTNVKIRPINSPRINNHSINHKWLSESPVASCAWYCSLFSSQVQYSSAASHTLHRRAIHTFRIYILNIRSEVPRWLAYVYCTVTCSFRITAGHYCRDHI